MTLPIKAKKSLTEICAHVNGRLQGNAELEITGVCALDEQAPGCMSFARNNSKAALENATAAAFFVPEDFDTAQFPTLSFVLVKDPFAALVSLIPMFSQPVRPAQGFHPKAEIDPSANIGKNVSIGAFAVIGERAEIGDDCTIHPHVTIYPDVTIGSGTTVHAGAVIRETSRIGRNSTIHAGAVVGTEGFGYVPDKDIGLRAIPQIGGVRLADNIDIGANSCIDRATFGNTTIDTGTKIDNLVQVGHNVKIGKFSILCGQVGIAGSTTIGDRCTFAGSSGVGDHVTIVSDVRVAAKAGAVTNLDTKGDYAGYPAIPGPIWHRQRIALQKLPELMKRVRALEKKEESK